MRLVKQKNSLAISLALLAGLLSALWMAPARAQAQAGDPAFVGVSFGRYDFNRKKDPSWEFGAQYRSDLKLWIFQPMAGVMHTVTGSTDIYAGISLDIFFGNRIVFRPSFAPSIYIKGGGEDLGYLLEFRSAAALEYRFDDRSRLGVELYHMSNAHLGDKNPGEESIVLTYALPVPTIQKWFGD